MSTLDTVFLIITACAISLFFILGVVVMVMLMRLMRSVKKIIDKAEDAIDTVESASETIRNIGQNASGPLAVLKIINNIMTHVKRK